jgi:formate dehydrogenase
MPAIVTYCRICEAACGLLADVEDEQIVALRPDPKHVVSKGFACAKGTRFLEVHRGSGRVNQPLMRRDGELQRASWPEVNRDIGRRLRRIIDAYGPHAVAVYVGNPSAFSYTLPVYATAFIRAIGTRNYFSAGSLDCNNKFFVARKMLGSAATHPVPDLDRARFALLIGTNPSVSQSSFVNAPRMTERLQAITARGGRVVIVDPRRTETARMVGEHVAIRPDTDAALLLCLLHVIFAEKLFDARAVEAHATGLAGLKRAVDAFSPTRVAQTTGIAAETLCELARAFARAPGAFCHISTGVNQGRFGNIAYAAKIALELITGNLDKAGGALIIRGAADTAGLARLLGLDREPPHRSRIGNFPPVLGTLPTGILADEIQTPGPGQVRALICLAGNPMLSAPGGDQLRSALQDLELHVSVDLFVNDTGAHATHVLPAADFLEREDFPLTQLQLQPEPYVQWTDAVVPPHAGRRQEWQILLDLAEAAGLPLFGSRAADAALRLALKAVGPRGLALPLLAGALGPRPLAALRAAPHGIALGHLERPGRYLRSKRKVPIVLDDSEVWARLDELRAELDRPPTGLRLISRRQRLGHNSWMHDNARLSLPAHLAYFAAADADALGIRNGSRVRLSANGSSIELTAAIDTALMAGVVSVPHGYGHEPGSSWHVAKGRGGQNVNRLAASAAAALDPQSGMAQLVGVELGVEVLAEISPDSAPKRSRVAAADTQGKAEV